MDTEEVHEGEQAKSAKLDAMQCCKCESNVAVVGCTDCAKSFNTEEEKGVMLCNECFTTVHHALGKFSALHRTFPLQTVNKVDELKQECTRQIKEYMELKNQQREAQLEVLNQTMKQINANYLQLQEQVTTNLENLKLYLDTKLAEFLATAAQCRDHKLELLSASKKLLEESVVTSPDVAEENDEEMLQNKLSELKQLLASLKQDPSPSSSFLPQLVGGTSCGFAPELVTLQRASICMMMDHQEEPREGDIIPTTVIGTLTKEGTFWVRMLPDEFATQDIVLRNISNSLQVEFSTMSAMPKLSFLQPGDLCAAKYSQDQRWYRARVVNPKARNGKVAVFFVDYGNTEELPLSSLAPLDEKYQVYPFQMVQCCFSTETNYSYEREVRWKFTDLTHNRQLSATILQCAQSTLHGTLHLVKLEDHTDSEPFDIGKTILLMAEKRPGKNESSIRCRDIRLKKPDLPANFEHIVSTATSTPAAVPTQQTQVAAEGDQSEPPQGAERSKALENSSSSSLSQQADRPDGAVDSTPREECTGEKIVVDSVEPEQSQTEGTVSPPREGEVAGETVIAVEAVSETTDAESVPLPQGPDGKRDGDALPESQEVTEVKEEEEQKSSHKPQAMVKPLKIEKEPSPALSQNGSAVSEEKSGVSESSLLPDIEPNSTLELSITTELSPDGSFWAQLPTSPEFDTMVEKLQEIEQDLLTPVFFNPGDLCAAIFSDDECWYRARIEDVAKGVFTVRYVDFGNSEKRENQHLAPLQSEFRMLPFQALHCSIADETYNSFSQISIDKFDQILTNEEMVSANVVKVEDGVVYVQLQLKISGSSEPVDVNWEVCSADVSKLQSMNFTSKKSDPKDELDPLISLPELTTTTNWADCMDEIASPLNDGFLTLAGAESSSAATSDRSKTPTPTPPPVNEPAELTVESRRETNRLRLHSHSPTPSPNRTGRTSPNRDRPAPRLNMGVARSQILSSLGPKGRDHLRKERTYEGDTAKPRVDYGQRLESGGTLGGDTWDSTAPQHREPMRRRRQLEPDANQIRVYVKHMPLTKTIEDVKELFGKYGTVYQVDFLKEYKDRLHLIMDKVGGLEAIKELNGYTFSPSGRPLVVEKSTATRIPTQRHMGAYSSSPPRHHSPLLGSSPDSVSSFGGGERLKLFVKNIPYGKSLENVKELFSKYGKVYEVVPDPSRQHVFFLYTTPEAGRKAIASLHGRAISKNSKPLVVEESHMHARY